MGISIKYVRLSENAVNPGEIFRGYSRDSGFDLYAAEDMILPGRSWVTVPTGLAFELPHLDDLYWYGYFTFELQIRPKSSLAQQGISVLNTPGTIDNSYTGEIKVILYSVRQTEYSIRIGDKIAQAVLVPVIAASDLEFQEVKELKKTSRGNKGFGSTGSSIHTHNSQPSRYT